MSSTPQDQSKPLPKDEQDSSFRSKELTPSEIESLRRDKKRALRQLSGKFKDLFQWI